MPISKSQLSKLEALAQDRKKSYRSPEELALNKKIAAMSDQELMEAYNQILSEPHVSPYDLSGMTDQELINLYMQECKKG